VEEGETTTYLFWDEIAPGTQELACFEVEASHVYAKVVHGCACFGVLVGPVVVFEAVGGPA